MDAIARICGKHLRGSLTIDGGQRHALNQLLSLEANPNATPTACGGSDTPTPSSNFGSEAVNITLETDPNPPAAGQVELIVTLTDASGKPLDNAEVSLIASHKTMSGMNMNGKATAQGNRRYAITADFGMSGSWLVTVEVRGLGNDIVRKDFDLGLK